MCLSRSRADTMPDTQGGDKASIFKLPTTVTNPPFDNPATPL